MEQVGKFKLYSSEEVLDKHFGKVGTPRRDEFERSVASSVHAYELGEAIKKARLEQNLTQKGRESDSLLFSLSPCHFIQTLSAAFSKSLLLIIPYCFLV